MSSESDNESSHHKKKQRPEKSRSRSRERDRRHQKRDDRPRRTNIRVPQLNYPLASLKQFTIMQNEKISTDLLEKSYETYKTNWQNEQNQKFLRQYKKDAWFSQKYDPEVLDLLERDRKENSRRFYSEFIVKLEQGSYNKIDFRIKQPSQLGVLEQIDDLQETTFNLGFIINETLDIHLNQQIDITDFPYFGFDQDRNTLFIKSVPRAISRYDIRSIVENLKGYKYLTMSDPVKKMNLTRFCWIEFHNDQDCNKAALILSGLIIKNETLVISKSNTKVKRVKILKNYPTVRIQEDIDIISKLMIKLDQQVGIVNNPLPNRSFHSNNQKLDTFLLYLRKVHAYEYFTSTMYENQRILSLKVGSAFLRIENSSSESNQSFKQIKNKSEARIAKGSLIPDYMGILRDQVQDYIRQTDNVGKDQEREFWKCYYCDKKFKACDFLTKHMINKHEEIKFKKIQIIMEKLYLQDPYKITFSSLGDKDQKYRKFNQRREKKRDYKDMDEPEKDKNVKGVAQKGFVNFLDI